jgi:hypothetical protein
LFSLDFESRWRTQAACRKMQPYSNPWITDLPLPATSPRSLHSAVRAGGCANPTGIATHAGAEAAHAQKSIRVHSLGADQLRDIRKMFQDAGVEFIGAPGVGPRVRLWKK